MPTILTNLLAFGMRAGSGAISLFLGLKTYLMVGAVVAIAAGAGGWYMGETHEAKIYAAASVQAAQRVQAAQSAKDAKDFAKDKADYEKRLAADRKATEALEALLAQKPKLVPNPTKAAVSAAAMKALNDPAIVGDTQ